MLSKIETDDFFFGTSGSGYTVKIKLRQLNLTPMFVSVNHSQANDNKHFKGDAAILSQYCSHPMPEMYDMVAIVHRVRRIILYSNIMNDFFSFSHNSQIIF